MLKDIAIPDQLSTKRKGNFASQPTSEEGSTYLPFSEILISPTEKVEG